MSYSNEERLLRLAYGPAMSIAFENNLASWVHYFDLWGHLDATFALPFQSINQTQDSSMVLLDW